MKSRSAKNKGQRLSKEVKNSLLEALSGLVSDDIIVTPSGVPGEDLRLSPKARELFPYSVECKCQEKLNIWEALAQGEKNAGNHIPVLIFRRNRSKTYICLEFDKFLSNKNSSNESLDG